LRLKELEKKIPDMLLQASMFPKGSRLEDIFRYTAKSDYGALSKEMQRVLKDLEAKSFRQSLENFAKRNKSVLLERVVSLLLFAYESGADLREIFKETAEDIIKTRAIIEERGAVLAMQRYTVMATIIIVPLILGMIVGMLKTFSFSGLGELGFSNNQNLLNVALKGNYLYITSFSIIASAFLSLQENNWKKIIVYASLFMPLSLMIYVSLSA
jgi:hypothetical protein